MQKSDSHPERQGGVMARENVYPPSLHLDSFSLSSQPGMHFLHRVTFGICGAAAGSFKI